MKQLQDDEEDEDDLGDDIDKYKFDKDMYQMIKQISLKLQKFTIMV